MGLETPWSFSLPSQTYIRFEILYKLEQSFKSKNRCTPFETQYRFVNEAKIFYTHSESRPIFIS